MVITACSGKQPVNTPVIVTQSSSITIGESDVPDESSFNADPGSEPVSEPRKKSNDIVILATSDVHCSPEKGFGYAGLYRIREKFKKEGCEVLLVDDGDEFEGHGEMFGTVTMGSQVIELMNKMGYDVAIPGNHDFAYGPDRFLWLTKKATYPYLSCNIYKNGKLFLKPYIIKEVNGKKIAFVGATTPRTIGVYLSRSMFMNANAKVIYDFKNGDKGKKLNSVIQSNVNAARAAGADYVFLMSHIGQAKKYKSYENITYVIENTSGIDAVLDGHSHDSKKFEVINKEGKPVPRIAMGSKFSRIGYVRISADNGSIDTGIYSWGCSVSASELFGIKNEMSEEVDIALQKYEDAYYGKTATLKFPLLVNDRLKKDEDDKITRVIGKRETNLGDFAADAVRYSTGADIALLPADKFGSSLAPGDLSQYSMYCVLPACKPIIVIEATGQEIIDALEWSCRKYPSSYSGFLQVSGISFKINTKIKHNVKKSKKGNFKRVAGKRRVTDVKIDGKKIELKKKYTVASYIRLLRTTEYGYTMFRKCKRTKSITKLDFQMLNDYLTKKLKGSIPEKYRNPSGQKRITTA